MLRVKQGQTTEEEIFANGQEPGPFQEFLNVLGELIGRGVLYVVEGGGGEEREELEGEEEEESVGGGVCVVSRCDIYVFKEVACVDVCLLVLCQLHLLLWWVSHS